VKRLTSTPLPVLAHVPGRTARPVESPAFGVAEAAPAATDPDRWRENEAWLYGFDLYAHGFFWEAHEVWEPVWMGAVPNSSARLVAQAMIQLTNACLKLVMVRPKAALRLIDHAAVCILDAGQGPVMGVDVAMLAREIDAFREIVREHGEANPIDARPKAAPIV
jgi:uncharacterized protein